MGNTNFVRPARLPRGAYNKPLSEAVAPFATHQTEDGEQMALVHYLELLKNQGKIVMFTAIPNSTWTPSIKQKVKNKAMGLRAGFPDLVIVTKNDLHFIEMKRPVGGVVSDSQVAWLSALKSAGYNAVVCEGFEAAKKYLGRVL